MRRPFGAPRGFCGLLVDATGTAVDWRRPTTSAPAHPESASIMRIADAIHTERPDTCRLEAGSDDSMRWPRSIMISSWAAFSTLWEDVLPRTLQTLTG